MYIPFLILSRTLTDGNCLYNACSLALVGNENLAVYLRCLTSLELHANAAFYSDHPLIEYQHKHWAFSTMKNAFAMRLSDTSLTAFEKDGHYAVVIAEANVNAQNHAFSSFMCMLALSSVTGCPIESYFPISDDHVSQEEWDYLQKMFNCCINP